MNQVLPRQRRSSSRRAPARDVRLVLVLHADRPPVERRLAVGREMEDELVAVVEEALAVDRLVVADGQIVLEPGARAGERLLDGDRLDPVDGVLQLQMRPRRLRHVERRPRVGRLGADVQEQRAVLRRAPAPPVRPTHRSTPDTATRHRVVVGAVADAEVVGRRRDDRVERSLGNDAQARRGSRRDRTGTLRRVL